MEFKKLLFLICALILLLIVIGIVLYYSVYSKSAPVAVRSAAPVAVRPAAPVAPPALVAAPVAPAAPIGQTGDSCYSNIMDGVCNNVLKAPSKTCNTALQLDGNLVSYDKNNQILWNSGTSGTGTSPYKLIMQSDGNLVLYDKTNKVLWNSGSGGKGTGPYHAIMQDDCNFVVYDKDNRQYWHI